MQIDANVAEADVGVVKIDQNVDFTVDAFPMQTFHGKVVQVRNAPITVQNVVTYDTVIGVSNPDLKLKPGMTANVSIVIAHKDDVLQIKNAALRYRPPDATPGRDKKNGYRVAWDGLPRGAAVVCPRALERTVYVLPSGAGRPQPAQIKTGISDGIVTEVVEGSEGRRPRGDGRARLSDGRAIACDESLWRRVAAISVTIMERKFGFVARGLL